MINTIIELVSSLAKAGETFTSDIHRQRFIISQPGSSDEKIIHLERLLGEIPDSYKNIIRKYQFNKVDIGYFGISPRSYQTNDTVDSLIKANLEDPFLPKDFLEKKGLVWIGSNNDHTVYLATRNSEFKEGEIILIDEEILIDIEHPRNCDIQILAKDFEQFLIVAGNLNQIHGEINEDDSNWEGKKSEFIERLKTLGVSEEYHPAWLSVF